MRTLIRLALLALTTLIISGCSYKVGFNSSYLPPAGIVGKTDGKALVLMTQEEETWIYSGHPTSFTGGGTTLTVPMGNITKQVALEVFSRHFAQVDTANDLGKAAGYTLVVNPRVKHFEYAYNQLKNLGFAITPEVKLELGVKLFDGSGQQLLDKTYVSGNLEGESYMMSGSPEEKVNKALHQALYDLMSQAARDSLPAIARQ